MIIIENCDVDAGNESYHADADDLIRSIILMSKHFFQEDIFLCFYNASLLWWVGGDENADFRGFQNIGKDFHRLLRL